MAGSRKWFVYTTDAGNDFAIELDESNTEAVNGATQDFPNTGSPATVALPRNIKPRYAVYQNAENTITRKCVALTATILNGLVANVPTITDQVSNQTLILRRIQGEKSRLLFGQDTGLNDGDAT